MLKLEHVSSGYGKRQVLFDVSLELGEGEIGLLVGSNGSGKSTVLKTVYGLLPLFNEGKVVFEGENIVGAQTSDLLRKGLLYIPQKNFCFDTLSVQENLEISGLSLDSQSRYQERFEYAINLFPMLRAQLKRSPMKLSGGERRLLSLAMASLYRPKMIMVDEPLAGLSQQNIELVRSHIQYLNDTEGIAFLIVEHRISELFGSAYQLIGLKRGAVCICQQVLDEIDPGLLNEILV